MVRVMDETIMTVEERLDILERKLKIYEDMINHMNNVIRDNLIQKIEQVTRDMVSEGYESTAKNNDGL
jgi:hypothetical protein